MPAGTILLTGGAGYIGSHTAVEVLDAGWDVVIVDNLANASPLAVDRVRELATRGAVTFHEVDVLDTERLRAVFAEHPVDAVVHFAGLKAVGESVAEPWRYHEVNVGGAISLVKVMRDHGVRDLVFSSSCTVYGEPESVPITEDAPLRTQSPYGGTKLYIEQMLREVAAAEPGWRTVLLRYFNPVGAHPSGRIGEDPRGVPNNLLPYVMQVAVGRHPAVRVFGDDYPTPDGTGVRDYIHVVDLARGHVAALQALEEVSGCRAVNLGTGSGASVLEVIAAASRAIGREIPYEIHPRRPGDVTAAWADPSLAHELLGWRADRGLDAICADAWRWQSANPEGYATPA
jgi:UDP-glucose 4-epimerase